MYHLRDHLKKIMMPDMTTAASELPKLYSPGVHEEAARKRWDTAGGFHVDAGPDGGPPFCILMPPPNVTGALHLGHALNNTIQDVLTRQHRMRGYRALWLPGTDHAGIATQMVVEKRLRIQGKRRTDFSREEFVAQVQAWKDEYEETITGQLRELGATPDWDRQRFTMDPVCSAAVREAFFRLFRDGLIYRGKRLVNWDPVAQTALADDEVEMREVDGSFWYLRYPLVNADGAETGDFVTVATTRPETMLGDTAIAVHPSDPDRSRYIGQQVRLPIVNRIIPVVGDEHVVLPDPDAEDPMARYASGFLKVTPAHDPNDWDIGQRHKLDAINVLAPDASISIVDGWDDCSEEASFLVGMSRDEARAAIVSWFKEHSLLDEVRPCRHVVGFSSRSHVPIEPWLSDQWYVAVTDDRLVGAAQRALSADQRDETDDTGTADDEGDRLRFHPARYARTYSSWHASLRDWCISRQLWWGHRIPVWSRHVASGESGEDILQRWTAQCREHPDGMAHVTETQGDGLIIHLCLTEAAEMNDALLAEMAADGFTRDEDVLDTWFSSALWPLNTMGWPYPDAFPGMDGVLETFNPTQVLCTGRDIISLWVSRMVMFSRYFNQGTLPFHDVYIHPMIQDGFGQRMSKSLGNGVDPRDIIHSHGGDALRFTLLQLASSSQDVRLSVDMVSPFTGATFAPEMTCTAAEKHVAAAIQTCPETGRKMLSGYGVTSGEVVPDDDVPLARNTSSRFDAGRNFCNKIWNAARFAISRIPADLEAEHVMMEDLGPADAWILHRLSDTMRTVDDALFHYQFNRYADAMYDFLWRDFCDWYLESIKPTVRERPSQQAVLRCVLDASMRLLHPACPFITETVWQVVSKTGSASIAGLDLVPADVLASATWPSMADAVHNEDDLHRFTRLQALVSTIRAARAQVDIPPSAVLALHCTKETADFIESMDGCLQTLAGVGDVLHCEGDERPADSISIAFEGEELSLAGHAGTVDPETEKRRLLSVLEEKTAALDRYEKKLAHRGYVDNAPSEVVEETRDRAEEAARDIAAAQAALAALVASDT